MERRNKKTKSVGNGEGSLYYSETLKCWIFQYVYNGKRKTLKQKKNETVKDFKARVTKLKNDITGAVLEKTFNPSDKYPGAEIEKREMQYLYNDGDLYYFMDNETYEQLPLNKDQLGDTLKFLKENINVTILSFKGNVFAVEPPTFVELEVTYTEPGFAGNTTTTSGKPATLETGTTITVPLFVNIGDTIRIDTRTGEYMERI